MYRDPFYRQIIEGLSCNLDGLIFESCAVSLLRDAFPSIAPIRGGGDLGMDGAVADGLGPPFPLVATTAKSVIGNLTRNLDSYVENGGVRRKVLVATSRSLSPRKRRNLEDRASEKGFQLVQIFDSHAIADRLYHSPRWCSELLGIAARSQALSRIPLGRRGLPGQSLLGREAVIAWIAERDHDIVVSGQPGVGKTAVLEQYANESDALFVVSTDFDKVVEGLRRLQPSAVIVDDAHTEKQVLRQLRHYRFSSGADFRILSSTWTFDAGEVVEALGLSGSQVRELRLLNRDEIVAVVKACGVDGPNSLVREIVDQARGRAGLAQTLSTLILSGGPDVFRKILKGDLLHEAIQATFRADLADGGDEILAGFALGGRTGRSMREVSGILGERLSSVRSRMARLAAGGIVSSLGPDLVSVEPEALRVSLINSVLFSGGVNLSIECMLGGAPVSDATLDLLISAKMAGANVPTELVERELSQVSFSRSGHCIRYAWAGSEEALWLLRSREEIFLSNPWPCLEHVPEAILPLLFQHAVDRGLRNLNSDVTHPLRLLSRWLRSPVRDPRKVQRRRVLTLDALASWTKSEFDPNVGAEVLARAVHPGLEEFENDPGSGRTVTMLRGVIPSTVAGVLREEWVRRIEDRSVQIDRFSLKPFKRVVEACVYPGSLCSSAVSASTREALFGLSRAVMKTLLTSADKRGEMGIVLSLSLVASRLEIDLPDIDPEFETLFAAGGGRALGEAEMARRRKIEELAGLWLERGPQVVSDTLVRFLEFGQVLGDVVPGPLRVLCGILSRDADDCGGWLSHFTSRRLHWCLVAPFFSRLVAQGADGWEEWVGKLLVDRDYSAEVARQLLYWNESPNWVWQRVLEVVESDHEILGGWLDSAGLKRDRCLAMLASSTQEVSWLMAYSAWRSGLCQEFSIAEGREWQRAVLRVRGDFVGESMHGLSEIFEARPDLAECWIADVLKEDGFHWRISEYFPQILKGLEFDARRRIIEGLECEFVDRDFLVGLVGENCDLLRLLFGSPLSRSLQLSPLSSDSNGLPEMVKCAIDSGFDLREICEALLGFRHSFCGNDSGYWSIRVFRFEVLAESCSGELRKVFELALDRVNRRRDSALKAEAQAEIYGDW